MKLHLGSGKRRLDTFVHVDLLEHPNTDVLASIDSLEMFEDNQVSEIYTSHSFEYFDLVYAREVLIEWLRVLKPGGYLYLSVPNFDALLKIYSKTSDLKSILGPLFGRWELNNQYIYHRTVYNRDVASKLLTSVGFVDIEDFNANEYLGAIDPSYDDYSLAYFPHMDKSGIQISLNLKSRKPF